MNKPKIWAAQEPLRKNADGRWISKGLDLASAAEYGDLIVVWPPDTSIMARSLLEDEARAVALRYNEQCDYVLALGSPSLIAVLGWAIGNADKQLRILEWDRALRRYYPTLGVT